MKNLQRIFLILVFGLIAHIVYAQSPYGQEYAYKPNAMTLRIGDNLPDSLFHIPFQVMDGTGQVSELKLGEHRDKLIILDFWATWCGPCRYSLNQLNRIVGELQDERVAIVPVAYESAEVIQSYWTKQKFVFPTILSDTRLGQYFPHSGIPHMVWIYQGKVLAIPESGYYLKEYIMKALDGDVSRISQKEGDYVLGHRPEALADFVGKENLLYQRKDPEVTISKFHPKLKRIFKYEYEDADSGTSFQLINNDISKTLYELYQHELFKIGGGPIYWKDGRSLRWEINQQEKAKILAPSPRRSYTLDSIFHQDSLIRIWENNYIYSLTYFSERDVPEQEVLKDLQLRMGEFMAERFGLYAVVEPAEVIRYAVLTKIKGVEAIKLHPSKVCKITAANSTQKSPSFVFGNVFWSIREALMRSLPDLNSSGTYYFLDESGMEHSLKIFGDPEELKRMQGLQGLDAINKEMASYGLKIVIKEEAVPVLKIRHIQ